MEEYKDNSDKAKVTKKEETKEKPKLHSVVKSDISKEKSLKKKFKETFSNEDRDSIFEYVLMDVIAPTLKDGVLTAVIGALSMLFYGDPSKGVQKGNKDYSRLYSGNKRTFVTENRNYSRIRSSADSLDEFIFNTRVDAVNTLNALKERIDEYDVATVADFYDAIGEFSNFQDNKYGWYDLTSAYISQTRGGYCLILPKPRYID